MSDHPIYKVGLVLWRAPDEVCLVQVKAKSEVEQGKVNFGLPKGTRRYLDGSNWVDARDAATAAAHEAALEPMEETAKTEAAEEIGLPAEIFDAGSLESLGPRPFHSRKGGRYDIHWFMMQAPDDLMLGEAPDAHAVRWVSLQEVRTLPMNEGYRAVIEEALMRIRPS